MKNMIKSKKKRGRKHQTSTYPSPLPPKFLHLLLGYKDRNTAVIEKIYFLSSLSDLLFMSLVPSASELSTPNFHSFLTRFPLIHHTINKAGMCSEQCKYLSFSSHPLSTSSFPESVWELPPLHALNKSEHNRQCLKCKEEIQLTKETQSGDPLTADGSSGLILLL